MRHVFFLYVICFSLTHTLISQTSFLDSLKKQCYILSVKDFDKVITLSNQGIKTSLKNKDSVSFAFFTRYIGQAYYFKGDYSTAAILFFKAIHVLERHSDRRELALAYNELAKLYRKTRKLKSAEETYAKAMVIYEELKDSANISTNYNESGVVFEYANDYNEALRRYKRSLSISERLSDTVAISYALSNMAGVYSLQNKYKESDIFLKTALNYRKHLKDTFALALNYSDIGMNSFLAGEPSQALMYLDSSNQIAIRMNYPELQSNNYSLMAQVYEKQKDPAKAYVFYKQHIKLKENIFTLQSEQQLNELTTKYESGKKDLELLKNKTEIESQQEQNLIKSVIIISILIMALLISLLLYSYNKRKKLRQKTEMEVELTKQKELRIKSVIEAEEKERRRIAQDLHDGIGQILSAAKLNLSSLESTIVTTNQAQKDALKNTLDLIDDSVKEVRTVSHNMMPNVLIKLGLASAVREFITKLGNLPNLKIDLEIVGLNERLEENAETALYRAIQEIVNNIIKHAKADKISIQLIRHDKELSVVIEDNGVGFDVDRINEFGGIGLKNILSRVEFINGSVHFDSLPGRGTTVLIDVPVT